MATAPSANAPSAREEIHPRDWKTWLALVFPFVIFALLAVSDIGRRPMWRDEMATREFATLSWGHLVSAVNHIDLVMAPYYALMHLVTLFSPRASALRLPSVGASIVILACIVDAVRARWGVGASAISGAFLVASGTFLDTATTARAYALAAMFLAIAYWITLSWKKMNARGVALWCCVCCFAVLMQLFSVLVVPALAVALARRRSLRTAALISSMPLAVAGIVVCLTRAQASQVSWIHKETFQVASAQLESIVGVSYVWPLFLAAFPGVLIQVLRRRADWFWITTLLTCLLPPFLLWGVSEVSTPVFVVRYAIFFIPGLAALLGASVGLILKFARVGVVRFVLSLVLVVACVANESSAFAKEYTSRKAQDATATLPGVLSRIVKPGDTVIYEASRAAGGEIYGWALFGGDKNLQTELLNELIHGRGAMLQIRRVVTASPMSTRSETKASGRTWVISSSGPHAPKPDLSRCRYISTRRLSGVPTQEYQCP